MNGTDGGIAIAVDGSNNVIVTGPSDGGAGSSWITRRSSIPARGSRSGPTATTGRRTPWRESTPWWWTAPNNVIVTGSSSGGFESGFDYATIKYSSAGEALWTNRYTGVGNYSDDAVTVTVDRNNDVIVTGSSFSSQVMMSSDFATIRYSSAGVPLSTAFTTGRRTALTCPPPWRWTAITT